MEGVTGGVEWSATRPLKMLGVVFCSYRKDAHEVYRRAVGLVQHRIPIAHDRLNKGEARNALARAVFFYRLSEIRVAALSSSATGASGLNLVKVAIVLWIRSMVRLQS
jgi:hypothetical protein